MRGYKRLLSGVEVWHTIGELSHKDEDSRSNHSPFKSPCPIPILKASPNILQETTITPLQWECIRPDIH